MIALPSPKSATVHGPVPGIPELLPAACVIMGELDRDGSPLTRDVLAAGL